MSGKSMAEREAAKRAQRLSDGLCPECGHAKEHHTEYGCKGSYPDGVDGVDPQEVFYGECHCPIFRQIAQENEGA